MLTTEQFIALSLRNVTVIRAIARAMEAMQVVDLAAVEIEGTRGKLNFSREIAELKEALDLMGQDSNQRTGLNIDVAERIRSWPGD